MKTDHRIAVALITAAATIIAALIGGLFLLASRSPSNNTDTPTTSSLIGTTPTPTPPPSPSSLSVECNNSNFLKIWYNNGNDEICFTNPGNINLTKGKLSNITEIDSGNNCGWVRTSDSSGSSRSLPFNSYSTSYAVNLAPAGIGDIIGGNIQGQNCSGSLTNITETSFSLSQHKFSQAKAPLTQDSLVYSTTCNNSDDTKIWYNNGSSVECFTGNGYAGLGDPGVGGNGSLSNITEIDSGNSCGWVRVYGSSGGYYVPFNSYTAYYQANNTLAYTTTLTQVDIQGQSCAGSH